jgi:dTDP-4-amino-4,6-dideoxygalactose transaminase
MGIQQLRKADRFQARREAMATVYFNELKGMPVDLPPAPNVENSTHAWHLFVLRLRTDKVSRDEFIIKMAEKGIGCSVHFIPLHLHPYWRDTYRLNADDFPNALSAYKDAVSLPLYTKMTDTDQKRVIEAVREILCG